MYENTDAQIRKEQNGFHQREVHRGMNKKRVYTPSKSQQKRFTAQKKPKTFQAKGHDKVIAALQKSGETVNVFVTYLDAPIIGKIIGRDRFTITIQGEGETVMMVFKSAIGGIVHKKIEKKTVEVKAPEQVQ